MKKSQKLLSALAVTAVAVAPVTAFAAFEAGKTGTATVTEDATVTSGSNDAVATVEIEGTTLTATGVTAGEFTVTLSDEKQYKITVAANGEVTVEDVTPAEPEFEAGKTGTATVTENATVTAGSNDAVATVEIEGTTLTATGVTAGEFTVTLSDDKQYKITVAENGEVTVEEVTSEPTTSTKVKVTNLPNSVSAPKEKYEQELDEQELLELKEVELANGETVSRQTFISMVLEALFK